MEIVYAKALWGMESDGSLREKLARIRDAGYQAVEAPQPAVEPGEWAALCGEHNLCYIGMIFADDAAAFTKQLRSILAYDPILVNAHSGRDRMGADEARAFFREAIRAGKDCPVAVAHETHRRRVFYSPWSTAAVLREFPELRVCADFSHWCAVCESLLEDMGEEVSLAASRAVHIHGRVGHPEGPQVSDPRAPEYRAHVERHEGWWDAIREARMNERAERLTFTPEFGPPGYMQTLPYTQQPVANLWDICLWMFERQRSRWGG